MENIQIWFMETWQLLVRMFAHPIFMEWVYMLIVSFFVIFVGSLSYIRIKTNNSNSIEMPDCIVYRCGMWSFGLQAIAFIVYPLLFRSAILLFSWILFSPFLLIIAIDIYWFLILKNKYDNRPEDIA